jgi:hypothetical protein
VLKWVTAAFQAVMAVYQKKGNATRFPNMPACKNKQPKSDLGCFAREHFIYKTNDSKKVNKQLFDLHCFSELFYP